jgi:hydrogenase maturation protease
MNKILVMGIGNILMGDEGIGIHAINELKKLNNIPDEVTILDGGTGGFHLLSYLQEYPKIIMVDAALNNDPEGTVKIIKPKFTSDFPKGLSAHDIGLKDLIEAIALLDKLPEIYLITISIKVFKSMTMELTPAISQTIPPVLSKIKSILQSIY